MLPVRIDRKLPLRVLNTATHKQSYCVHKAKIPGSIHHFILNKKKVYQI